MDITSKRTPPELPSPGNSAFYLFYEQRLRENITKMRNSFAELYGNFTIAYSFKTNYLRRICDIVNENGCMAEVVSTQEKEYATYLHFGENRIVYNGVVPDPEGKYQVAFRGGYVNVDNIEEYKSISEIANRRKQKIKLGVRVNFDIGNGLNSRFGVDITGYEFAMLMREIGCDEYVSFGGFHCHIGTARPAKYWHEKITKMIELAKKYNASYVDLGGGMYGPMPEELASQFTGYASSFDEYADAVAMPMKEAFPDEKVSLIVEPGTALVGNTMDVMAHITGIKNVRGKTYITVDCNSNHIGMLCECRVIPVEVIDTGYGPTYEVIDGCIAGNTCLEYDYIRKEFSGNVKIGDTLVFKNCGAYSIGASRQFIVPRLGVRDGTTFALLKFAEDAGDVFRNYL